MPALLFVTSDPPATEVVLTRANGKSENFALNPNGIPLDPGVSKLAEQTGTLRVSIDTPGAHFSIIYPGLSTVTLGTNTLITGVKPRVNFQLLAERRGYISATRDLMLRPNETQDVDFGRLVEQTADLVVNATPRPFQLTVMWDGVDHRYFTSGKASSLPAGRKLQVTAEADSGAATTNITLEPGETRTLFLGSLTGATGYLSIRSSPDGAEVSFAVDGQKMMRAGVVDRIDNIPNGHEVTVTLRKSGYEDKTMVKRMNRSGETLDFTRLTPIRAGFSEPVQATRRSSRGTASIKVYGPNDDADIYVDGRPTGVKNGGVVSNLAAGQTYAITLHRMGFEDITENVTMNPDGSEKYEMFVAAKTTLQILDADIDAKLREIDAKMEEVHRNIPETEAFRREMNDWIDRTERLYKRRPRIWDRINLPLRQLKELVNARSSRGR